MGVDNPKCEIALETQFLLSTKHMYDWQTTVELLLMKSLLDHISISKTEGVCEK